MKLAKIIVLIILIAKSSIAFGQVNLFFSNSHDSCHAESIELSDNHHNSSEEDGCCDSSCDCLCCGHIFTFSSFDTESGELPELSNSSPDNYAFLYHFSFSNGIWQPPKVV